MKKKHISKYIKNTFFWLFVFSFGLLKVSSAQINVFSYQSIPLYTTGPCFFNIPPGPTAPISIGGYDHYGVVGGVYYSGNEFGLGADNNGNGTGFGIFYPFAPGSKYRVSVKAYASSNTMRLNWATSQVRSAVPSSCSPGFPQIILSAPGPNGFITNISGTYTDYILLDNFIPTSNSLTYFLISDNNTVNSIGQVNIQSVSINKCNPPQLLNVTSLGGGQVRVTYNPNLNPSSQYNLFLTTDPTIIYLGGVPIPIPGQIYSFPNIIASPLIVNVPGGKFYTVTIQNSCAPGFNNTSNNIRTFIN